MNEFEVFAFNLDPPFCRQKSSIFIFSALSEGQSLARHLHTLVFNASYYIFGACTPHYIFFGMQALNHARVQVVLKYIWKTSYEGFLFPCRFLIFFPFLFFKFRSCLVKVIIVSLICLLSSRRESVTPSIPEHLANENVMIVGLVVLLGLLQLLTPRVTAIPRRGNEPWSVILCKFKDSDYEPRSAEWFAEWISGGSNPGADQ